MTVEQVGWQYAAGIEAMWRLTEMLGTALENAQIPIESRSGGWDFRGYWLDKKKFWAGVYFTRPNIMQLEFGDKPNLERFQEQGHGGYHDGKYAYRMDLGSESIHFFARTKESQLECLTEFLRQKDQSGLACLP